MNSSDGDRPQRRPGFPIRTPSDQRLVGSSPRHFAASHVLHRPPDAKASTVCPYNTTHKRPNRINCYGTNLQKNQDARVHYPVLTQHHQKPHQPHTRDRQATSAPRKNKPPTPHTNHQVDAQGSRRCLPRHPTAHRHTLANTLCQRPHHAAGKRPPKNTRPPPASTGQPTQGADLTKQTP